jgi:hypothetical protein
MYIETFILEHFNLAAKAILVVEVNVSNSMTTFGPRYVSSEFPQHNKQAQATILTFCPQHNLQLPPVIVRPAVRSQHMSSNM